MDEISGPTTPSDGPSEPEPEPLPIPPFSPTPPPPPLAPPPPPPTAPADPGASWTWEGLPRTEPFTPAATAPPPSSPPRRRRVGIVALAVLLVAGGAAGSVAALKSGSKKAAAPPSSSPTATASPSPSAPPSPTATPAPLPPVAFEAQADKLPIAVNLSWQAPFSGTAVTNYYLYRGDTRIAALPAATTEYTDTNIKPGKHYTYEVESRSGALLISPKVSAEIDVPVPDLKDARLAGNFNVTATPTSQYGFISDWEKTTFGWNFKAKCSDGPCDSTWKDLYFKELKTVLDRAGATYKGSDDGKFDITCGGVKTTSTVVVNIHVTKAKAISGEWRASKLEGTFTVTDSAQLGCTSSQVVFAVVVKLA